MANEYEIVKVLAYLEALYPRFNLSKASIDAYVAVLADIPYELLDSAALDIGSRSDFFPSAAELRSAAFELMEQKSGVPSAYEAWGEVFEIVVHLSPLKTPKFSHPLVARALKDIGGLYHVRSSENVVSERSRFIDAYDQRLERARRKARMLPAVRNAREMLDVTPGQFPTMEQVQKSLSRLTEGGDAPLKH